MTDWFRSLSFRALAAVLSVSGVSLTNAPILLGDTGSAVSAALPRPVLPGTWRLAGSDPELPDKDLAALRGVVGDAPIVGQTIHTSGGFYRMKHGTEAAEE